MKDKSTQLKKKKNFWRKSLSPRSDEELLKQDGKRKNIKVKIGNCEYLKIKNICLMKAIINKVYHGK